MRIGELSKLSGATLKALRLYESKKLLPPVPRIGQYRDYQRMHLDQVLLIRQAQALGFKLSELQAIQQDEDGFHWPQLLELIKHKQQQTLARIKALQELNESLEAVINELESCPISKSTLDVCSDQL